MREFTSIVFLLFVVFGLIAFSGCTYNVSMIHTEGQATDVMDSQQSADVDPSVPVELNMPASSL